MKASADLAFIFPGQGSQSVGMGAEWARRSPAAARTFEEADAALGEPLSKLCWEGPAETLQLTENTQPAILTVSIAIWRSLPEDLRPAWMAGHSLGEYSALVAAGALEFSDAVRLVRQRGRLMQQAVSVGEGAMAAIIGLDSAAVEELVAAASSATEICAVANYNSPEQTVVAGAAAAVDRLLPLAKERGAKRALPLPVSAPFHSPMMEAARVGLAPYLEAATFRDPVAKVVSNVDAQVIADGEAARDGLLRQVDGAVRWVESIRLMADSGVARFVEVGPGKVLTGLARRIAPGLSYLSVAEPDALGQLG